jgi:superfamily II RNA helicase
LEQLSVLELGLLCIAVVFEPRKGAHKPPLDRKSKTLEEKTEKVIHRVNRMERAAGMKDLSKHCAFHLSPAMEAWIKGAPFRDILKHTNSDEGEIVRYLRMTIQVLREIAETPVTDELRSRIYQLISAINRDVVDSEKQLRG